MKRYIQIMLMIIILTFTGCASLTEIKNTVFKGEKEVNYGELQFKNKIAYNITDREITPEDEPFTGRATSLYPESNKTKYEVAFKEGKLHGNGRKFHENGKLMVDVEYKDGKKDGLEKAFYESGKLQSQVEFEDGVEEGEAKSFYENQKLKSVTTFSKGIKNGDAKSYFENGNLKYEVKYKNGIREGQGKLYYENGIVEQLEIYEGGELAEIKVYDEKGVELD